MHIYMHTNIYIYTYTSQTRTQDSAVKHPSQIVRDYSSFVGYYYMIEGSLEAKLPTIWRDEKQSRAEAERRGRLEERRSEEKE